MFLTREIPSVFGEPLAPEAIKCCSLCVEETQTQKCTACRIANTTHRKDTLIRSLNSNSGIKLSKKLKRKVAHFGAAVDCCRLGINTTAQLEEPQNSACLRYRFTEQVKCARA